MYIYVRDPDPDPGAGSIIHVFWEHASKHIRLLVYIKYKYTVPILPVKTAVFFYGMYVLPKALSTSYSGLLSFFIIFSYS